MPGLYEATSAVESFLVYSLSFAFAPAASFRVELDTTVQLVDDVASVVQSRYVLLIPLLNTNLYSRVFFLIAILV